VQRRELLSRLLDFYLIPFDDVGEGADLVAALSRQLDTQRTSIGVVKFWRDDKGYGVIESLETAPWGIWCSFGAIEPNGGIATLPSGEQFPVTYGEDGRAYSPSGERVVSGYITGGGPLSLTVGERVPSCGTGGAAEWRVPPTTYVFLW